MGVADAVKVDDVDVVVRVREVVPLMMLAGNVEPAGDVVKLPRLVAGSVRVVDDPPEPNGGQILSLTLSKLTRTSELPEASTKRYAVAAWVLFTPLPFADPECEPEKKLASRPLWYSVCIPI